MSADKSDVIIVGAGAGGSFASYGLSRAGLKVVLIELGPSFEPARDYYTDQPDWEFKEPFKKHVPQTYTSELKPLDKKFEHLRTTILNNKLTHREFTYVRACGVGGSTLRYQGEAHRFPPHAFRMKSLYGMGVDWPVSYADMAPYYEKAESLLSVAGSLNPFFPKETPYPNPPHPLSCASQKVADGCKKLGLNLVPNTLAILSRQSKTRPACIYCKLCASGCMPGDKSSTDVAVIPYAIQTGNLKIMTETAVLKIIVSKTGLAEGVLVFDKKTGEKTMLKARTVILAGGAIETPRLLLNSSDSLFPNGLLNSEGFVGAYLMENLMSAVLFLFNEKVGSYKGLPIDSKVWEFSAPQIKKGYNRGFSIGSMGAPDGIIGPASFALMVARGYGKDHRMFMEKYYGAHSMVFCLAEHLPKATNRLVIDKEAMDEFGMPKAKADIELDHEDLAILDKMIALSKDIALASGAARILGQYSNYDYSSASHACGTARMGFKEKDSVVNSNCQSHAVKNLFITDASILPTQGCGASPSLTIQALALRASDHIISEFKKDNLQKKT